MPRGKKVILPPLFLPKMTSVILENKDHPLDASSLIHDSHVLVAKTRYKETAKSCGSCALALWSNVLGSIENRIIFKISGIQTCQAKVHIPATVR
ncbi:unnamed protein product [Penicillium roqueforti FM164]|uniref:Uncharacterized protein n=1 Tax=Penicillium roqueforti (strain FM164) TaxID=1365484 RepID=W6QRI8_PENRF|nr:unnamed protein product [Penicillium roqueforti FM164]